MKEKTDSINDLTVVYGVAVVSVIIAFGLGAYALAAAICMFADTSTSLPGIFSVLGGGGVTSTITNGALAVLAGVVARLALNKIAASPEASDLVNSNNYTLINKVAKAFCYITAGAAIVAAVAVLLAVLLSINDYTPWKDYLLGESFPLVCIAAGLVAAGELTGKFVKAEIKPDVLAKAALAVAIVGMVLSCVAVIVETHTSSTPASTVRNTFRYLDY